MILNQSGQSIEIDGTVFAVGVRIGANSKSEYYGLEGRITEIATDDDKGTENEGPDIYCCFDTPTEPKLIKRLEKEFSDIFCSHALLTISFWTMSLWHQKKSMS